MSYTLWIFNLPDRRARLLRIREGHATPPLCIKYKMQEDPFQMPPIMKFTAESTREKEWNNIAAIHSGLVVATTWSFSKCKMGELRLVPEKYQNKNRTDFNVEAKCISLTHCGNFVIIGSQKVNCYNEMKWNCSPTSLFGETMAEEFIKKCLEMHSETNVSPHLI